MRVIRLELFALAAVLALPLVALTTGPAAACGGLFCNAQTQSPIFQSGERVVFIQGEDSEVTMHVEVSYTGEPTEFGWLIPILAGDDPKTRLEDLMGLSSQDLFTSIQSMTNPSWTATRGAAFPSQCDPSAQPEPAAPSGPGFGCVAISVINSEPTESLRGRNDEPPRPDSFVTDTAKIGPYDAQLIAAPKSSDALFDWLNANGYNQDESARPLLAHYVSQGFKFIGVRLASGKSTGSIRPIRLTLKEGGPCVPLRLTAIAATQDMPMRIWVFGPGRAIPKNFIHGVVNQQAITYPGGSNYDTVVSDAVAEAGGRAFITEMSGSASMVRDMLARNLPSDRRLKLIAEMNRDDFEDAWQDHGFTTGSPDYRAVVESMPTPTNTASRLALQKALVDEVARPRVEIQRLLNKSSRLTRLYTRIDPSDMSRDPIFGFNPELEDVPQHYLVTSRRFMGEDCTPVSILEWDDGRRFTASDNAVDAPFSFAVPSAPALLRAEVADEQGQTLGLHDNDILGVDAVMNTAALGVPTLSQAQREQLLGADPEPSNWPNKPAGFDGDTADQDALEDSGCALNGGQVMAGYLAAVVLFLMAWRRRRRLA